ncbi:16S rRNA (adenine(1518)-N(6)/adenine(1519)-N(6))-dimethyltransferase RsmA [Tenuibacillus multivorans]|uniref:Ribosomal RNA small subunit methyltransferase A n=1 Tax=Tenuibacillus multivorans TaxID=237069 RepID=A0A1G9W1G8_9BACI|nr:16S rRNA (adenine(1518)-N(6)/adenine(1519)-N(6))-dimethyltransferase RsmA [Tenuibacillus multivorans]GEL78268.1 ribosomal RNA small subunit methyltransferase A [Tenuibacillus multivorans]SDM78006.1 16S rRNA (adenine1518-N6/adenine1519-N6)-dimethyltransferase [Tenuibacillus multivorans]
MTKPIATVSRTRDIMTQHQLDFKKSLGQNFIIDANILKKIVDRAEADENTIAIEIGPGIGALTEQLALVVKHVYAFEIDQRLIHVLDDTLKNYDNVTIFNQDILEADLQAFIKENVKEGQSVKVVANLPYYITTPILMKLLMDRLPIESMTVMMQREVADRMAAGPNTKEYGSLSIAVQYYTQSKVMMTVPKTCFMPQPNVDSAILQLKRREEPIVKVHDENLFFELVRTSFGQRRKTIKNNLQRGFKDRLSKEELQRLFGEADIDPARRGESLSIEEFASLANTCYTMLEV